MEWAVRDINGDGYPDVLFNSAPVVVESTDEPPPKFLPPPEGRFRSAERTDKLIFGGLQSNIKAMFNVAGTKVSRRTNAFSSPFLICSASNCAVEVWTSGPRLFPELPDVTGQSSGFADVNGDGLPDRFKTNKGRTEVFLNTGSLSEGFFTAESMMELPANSLHSNSQYLVCVRDPPPDPLTTHQSTQRSGLRDLNGDGIPDFIEVNWGADPDTWSVRFGTGTGFSDAKPIEGRFALSQETENCGGTRSDTTHGLYDMDGDGQPEVVVLKPNDRRLDVYQLNAVPSAPAAGRLVKIANGYGAVTTITYRSAKEDLSRTAHQVPFPEIVVTAVETSDEAPTLYAYGDAELHFDPRHDAFIFPGYKRSVALRITSDQVDPRRRTASQPSPTPTRSHHSTRAWMRMPASSAT